MMKNNHHLRLQRRIVTVFLLLSFLLSLSSSFVVVVLHGFVLPDALLQQHQRQQPQRRGGLSGSLLLFASSINDNNNNNNNNREPLNLYKILGADPTDTPQQLRKHYLKQVKLTHPDAKIGGSGMAGANNINNNINDNDLDFRDVTAAWEILSNPKLRLRYDRQLKAKELAGSWEELLDSGFRSVAVPWFQKTVDTTASVVNSSSQTLYQVANVAKSMSRAMNRMELETKRRDLEQGYVSYHMTHVYGTCIEYCVIRVRHKCVCVCVCVFRSVSLSNSLLVVSHFVTCIAGLPFFSSFSHSYSRTPVVLFLSFSSYHDFDDDDDSKLPLQNNNNNNNVAFPVVAL
jgi:hypothetical protein